jgi:prepilin-type N-terminal cleavage/methylation domain-containing protein
MPRARGFTLIEVLLALIIMGVVTGAIYRLLVNSQRLSVAQAEQVHLQSNVRTGSLVVPNELRELNTVVGAAVGGAQNDILSGTPTTIRYRAMRGMGFICEAPAANQLRIAEATWTGLRAPDAARDDIYVFDDQDVNLTSDDVWQQLALTGAAFSATACNGVAPGYILDAAGVPAAAIINTPVRTFEVMRLELYADAGEWWLGARSEAVEANLQPILGPLTANGFGLRYFDANGALTPGNMANVRSVEVTVQGQTEDQVRIGGSGPLGRPQETLATQVLLRNSIRP